MYPVTTRALSSAPIFESRVADRDETDTKRLDAYAAEKARRESLPIQPADLEAGREWEIVQRISLPDDVLEIENWLSWFDEVMRVFSPENMRKDKARNVREVASILGMSKDPNFHTTAPGQQIIAEKTGLSERTVHKCVNYLIMQGFLIQLCTGRSKDLPGTDGRAYRARYILTLPNPESDITPIDRLVRTVLVRAIDAIKNRTFTPIWSGFIFKRRSTNPLGPSRVNPHQNPNPDQDHDPPIGSEGPPTVSEIARNLVAEHPWIRPHADLTPRRVASIIRIFTNHGYTEKDLWHAIERTPDGDTHPHSGSKAVTNPYGWLKYRLGFWLNDGTPVSSRTQRIEIERQAILARGEERHHQREEERRHAVSPKDIGFMDIYRQTLLEHQANRHNQRDDNRGNGPRTGRNSRGEAQLLNEEENVSDRHQRLPMGNPAEV